MTKSPVHSITDALPQDAICDRLGVKPRAIRAAREFERFPASWYREIKALCDERGLPCPIEAFNFKSPSADAPASAVGE